MSCFRMAARPGAILFDLDGVLVESFDAWAAVLEGCRRERGLDPLGLDRIRATWGQGIEADARSLFGGADPAALALDYERGFERHLDEVRAMPGAAEVLDALGRTAIPRAVVTNSPVALARTILDRLGLLGRVEAVAGGDEVPHGKPDPASIRLAQHRLGVGPSEGVMVGDTALDVAAAGAAGIPAIGFRIAGDHRIENLRELLDLIG